MTIHDRLVELFRGIFPNPNDDLLRYRKDREASEFRCEHANECRVHQEDEPIWSAAFGDSDTTVMVVGEAPSTTGGKGPHVGGLFADWTPNPKSPSNIRDFVHKHYNTLPYFTDLVKCGAARGANKRIIKQRAETCFNHLLLNEIKIMQPTHILCLGGASYEFIEGHLGRGEGQNGRCAQLIKLIHYSGQAQLPLTPQDKLEIIWPWQIGRPSVGLEKMPLATLSYFKKGPESCKRSY